MIRQTGSQCSPKEGGGRGLNLIVLWRKSQSKMRSFPPSSSPHLHPSTALLVSSKTHMNLNTYTKTLHTERHRWTHQSGQDNLKEKSAQKDESKTTGKQNINFKYRLDCAPHSKNRMEQRIYHLRNHAGYFKEHICPKIIFL